MGTCASQQLTEQNANAVRVRLQVDTLQTQYAVRNGISFLQVLHRFQNAGSIALLPGPRPDGQRIAPLTLALRVVVVAVRHPGQARASP